jgi:hypothetical protein
MGNKVKPLHKMQIRSVESKDFGFIRSLAAEFPTFSVPSDYILWFLTRFHPDYCRVLEQDSGDLKAYLVAVPTSDPANGIAIWQVAAAIPNRPFALEYFAAYLRDVAERTGVTTISFTASPDSSSLRLIRSLAKKFFDCGAEQLKSVPVGQGEHEFRLSINLASSKDQAKVKTRGAG